MDAQDAGARAVGFDLSPAMVAIARERELANASFHVADLAAPLTFLAGDSFDLAVALLVFHIGVEPLQGLRRILVPDGCLVLSTHHPADDVRLSATGNYFDLELLHDRWARGEEEFDVHFWRRPLAAMFTAFAAFAAAGFAVQELREPMPIDACRTQFPDEWRRLTTRPAFVFFSLVAVTSPRSAA